MGDLIKPIQTIYNGYKFRSRLEARWAVFFDAAGISYEYEPEGFKNDDGLCYLPDFYLPREKLYVEVKAPRIEKWEELYKALRFVGNGIDCLMILTDIPNGNDPIVRFPVIYFNPVYQDLMVRHCPFINEFEGPWISLDRRSPEKNGESDIPLSFEDWEYSKICNETVEIAHYNSSTVPLGDTSEGIYMSYYYGGRSDKNAEIVCNCFKKARQARFELGEKG